MDARQRLATSGLGLALALVAALAAPAHATTPAPAASTGDGLPLASVAFPATHNSFSGNINGTRGSILFQLNSGVRFLELDLNEDNYAANGNDYTIGHGAAGVEVDHSLADNPTSDNLRPWLYQIAQWSYSHPTHSPLILMLDLKDNLGNNLPQDGDFVALDNELQAYFGTVLARAEDYPGGLPAVGALRGKVIPLLSGDGAGESAREDYLRDLGTNPAVAINKYGQVIEVHQSFNNPGDLWYWSGIYGADGRITWLRHNKYGTGTTPSIAINDNGDFVEVHKSQNNSGLYYQVGHVTPSGFATWSSSVQFDQGVRPTVAFTDPAGTSLREIHTSQNNSQQRWGWNGSLNVTSRTVTWRNNATTSASAFSRTVSTAGADSVYVWSGLDGAAPSSTLLYGTPSVFQDRIRYEQTAFVEYQPGDAEVIREHAAFYAGSASDSSFIAQSRQSGKIVRAWDFTPNLATTPLANYPATDRPYDPAYSALLGSQVIVPPN